MSCTDWMVTKCIFNLLSSSNQKKCTSVKKYLFYNTKPTFQKNSAFTIKIPWQKFNVLYFSCEWRLKIKIIHAFLCVFHKPRLEFSTFYYALWIQYFVISIIVFLWALGIWMFTTAVLGRQILVVEFFRFVRFIKPLFLFCKCST